MVVPTTARMKAPIQNGRERRVHAAENKQPSALNSESDASFLLIAYCEGFNVIRCMVAV